MISKLTIDIAQSLLLARWRQTMIAAIAVTFSITMFIALLSFMRGLNNMLDGLVINRTPHVRLYNEMVQNPNQPISLAPKYKDAYHFISSVKTDISREQIYNSAPIMQALQADKQVEGKSAKIITPSFFIEGSIRIPGMIHGIDVDAESRLFHFNDYITKGSAADLTTVPNSIIPGKTLAEKLLANAGDVIFVTTSNGETFPLKVVAYFQSGITDFDKTIAYTSLSTAQKLLGKPGNYITEIQVKLKSVEAAPMVAKEYQRLFGCQAQDIQTANADFDTGSFIRSLISYMVGITLLVVAAFGIYNILNMMIYEKMDSIAILKATGFSAGDVKRIFSLISLGIGLFGGLFGLLIGYLLSRAIDEIPFITPSLPTITTYPVDYDPFIYVISISFTLVTTFLAGWFPAVKAGKVDPVIIIRGK
jgi:lipoprotein-releasing system permease protein